jgi:hypothetical protein
VGKEGFMSRRDTYRNTSRENDDDLINSKAVKMAFPDVWEQIFQEGKRVGYSERVAEERARTEESKRPATVPGEENKEEKKQRLIREYQRAHPEVSLKEAVLEVSKQHRDLFKR